MVFFFPYHLLSLSRENVDCTNVGLHLTISGASQPLKHRKCILNTISVSNNFGQGKQHVSNGIFLNLKPFCEDYVLWF